LPIIREEVDAGVIFWLRDTVSRSKNHHHKEEETMSRYIRTAFTLLAITGMLLYGFTGTAQVQGIDIPGESDQLRAPQAPPQPKAPLVTITQPGLYRLTKNLKVADSSQTGIKVTVSDVTIDLNGYAILGATECSGTPMSCGPTGNGIGVSMAPNLENVTIMNGIIRGMGSSGIWGQSVLGVRVDRVTLMHNGGIGVFAWSGTVSNSIIHFNGGSGIQGLDWVILGNNIQLNGGYGIDASPGSGYANNVILYNEKGDVSYATQMGGNLCSNGFLCKDPR
jgi:hypothetical protein